MFMKFPSIVNIRAVKKTVDLHLSGTGIRVAPIRYAPKIKLHGTNAGVVFTDEGYNPQKRSGEISVTADNAGFARFVHENKEYFDAVQKDVGKFRERFPGKPVTVFGEWCGPGVQKGVAISNIPEKIFAIFAVIVGDTNDEDAFVLFDDLDVGVVSHLLVRPTFGTNVRFIEAEFDKVIELDFHGETLSEDVEELSKLIDEIDEVDPWVKDHFGVEGHGEGYVYYPLNDEFMTIDKSNGLVKLSRSAFSTFAFKAKGEKHQVVKTKKSVSLDPEVVREIDEFIEKVVTEARLDQAVQEGCNGELDIRRTGDFLKWISLDIKTDVDRGLVDLPENEEWKDIHKKLTTHARMWYVKKANQL